MIGPGKYDVKENINYVTIDKNLFYIITLFLGLNLGVSVANMLIFFSLYLAKESL